MFFFCLTARCVCRTRNNKDAVCRDTTFILANPKQLHFRLDKAAIMRLYVSDNVKIKLYSCSHKYNSNYTIYGRDNLYLTEKKLNIRYKDYAVNAA